MQRREFITLFGGAAAGWPIVVCAQKMGSRKVGVLFPGALGADRERLISEGLLGELGEMSAYDPKRTSIGPRHCLTVQTHEVACIGYSGPRGAIRNYAMVVARRGARLSRPSGSARIPAA